MNRAELIDHISEKTGETKAATNRFLDSFIQCVQEKVADGDKVSLVGFGSFEYVKTSARQGRNPKTGETINIEAKTKPRFNPGADFRAAVNKG